jgi:hypothetical protein
LIRKFDLYFTLNFAGAITNDAGGIVTIQVKSTVSATAGLFCASTSNQVASYIDVRPAGRNATTAASFSFVDSTTGVELVAPNAPAATIVGPVPVSATLSLADYLGGGGILDATTVFQCEAAPIVPLSPTAIVGCALNNRYALSSSICGAARHASAFAAEFAPLLLVNVSQVTVSDTTAYCQYLQNQVQTSAGVPAASLPARAAFFFPAVEPSTARLAAIVSASLNSSVPLNATCQQTFASLFRGLIPPLHTHVTISCPQCTISAPCMLVCICFSFQYFIFIRIFIRLLPASQTATIKAPSFSHQ